MSGVLQFIWSHFVRRGIIFSLESYPLRRLFFEVASHLVLCSTFRVTIERPRAFCFRGLEAKDDRVLLYSVNIDRGMSSETALDLWDEVKDNGNDRGSRIKTGFYYDDRSIFKQCDRMFLIINRGRTSTSTVVARPNAGRSTYGVSACRWMLYLKTGTSLASFAAVYLTPHFSSPVPAGLKNDYVLNHFFGGLAPLKRCNDLAIVQKKWDQEFQLADIPSDEMYQRSCFGRQLSTVAFGGEVVPVLSKLLTAANPGGINNLDDDRSQLTLPSIVRIEPGQHEKKRITAVNKTTHSPRSSDDEDQNEAEGESPPVVGQNVACKLLGRNILRGKIVEVSISYALLCMRVRPDPTHGCKQCKDDTYTAAFTDGSSVELNSEEVSKARQLFLKEIEKLMNVKVSKADASNIGIRCSFTEKESAPRPLLADGDDIPDDCERAYEVEFQGDTPKLLVGLQFPKVKRIWYNQETQLHEEVDMWEVSVIGISVFFSSIWLNSSVFIACLAHCV